MSKKIKVLRFAVLVGQPPTNFNCLAFGRLSLFINKYSTGFHAQKVFYYWPFSTCNWNLVGAFSNCTMGLLPSFLRNLVIASERNDSFPKTIPLCTSTTILTQSQTQQPQNGLEWSHKAVPYLHSFTLFVVAVLLNQYIGAFAYNIMLVLHSIKCFYALVCDLTLSWKWTTREELKRGLCIWTRQWCKTNATKSVSVASAQLIHTDIIKRVNVDKR